MGSLIRSFDWSKTVLGNPETWPQPLRIAVRIMLDCPFGMYIAWGNDYIQLYNDGYRPILGANKHPQALGLNTRTTFAEIWSTIGPMFEGVMQGIPVGFPDFTLQLDRNGFIEECVFDFSYSPIRLEDGEVGGVLVTVIETTEKVKAVRALKESEQELKFAIKATELGTWDLNPATSKFKGNNRLKEWFGLKPEEEIELSLALDVIAERDRQKVATAIKTAMQSSSGGNYDVIYTIIHPQTKYERVVRAKGQAVFTPEGIPIRFNGTLQDVSKETVAHQLLTESENRLANERMVLYNSFMNAPAGIAIYKGQTHMYEFANLEHEKIARRKITIGKTVEALFPELESQGLIAMLNNVFLTGEPFIANEFPIKLHSEGTDQLVLGYYNLVVQPLMDDKGNTERILSHAVEVTDQVRAKQQIETSEKRFAAAVEAIQGILWTNNAKGEMEGEQRGWASLTGQSYEEYQGYGWANAVHREDAQPTVDAWNEAVRESKTFVFEHRIKTKGDGWKLFSIKAIPLLKEDGTIREWVGVHTDITEQKEAEEKIKESEAKFRSLAETVPHMIWTATADGNRNFFNKHSLDYTGLSTDALRGDGWQQTVFPEDLDQDVNKWNQSVATGEDLTAEKRIRRHDGAYRWHLCRSIAQKDIDGNIIGWMGTCTDITEQKVFSQELEKQVNERTTELEERKDFLETILETSKEYVAVYGKDLKLITINKATEILMGQKKEDVIGKTLLELMPHSRGSREELQLKSALQGDTIHNEPYQSDITGRYIENYINPLRDKQGNVYAAVAIANDVTSIILRQKEVEAAKELLQIQNQTFEAAERIANLGSYKWDMTTGVMEYSDNLFRLLDCEPGEFVPSFEKFLSFIHPGDLEHVTKNGEETRQSGVLVETPYRIISKKGNVKHFRSSGSFTGDADKRILIGTVQDISKDVEAAEELRTKNLELQISNTELTSFTYVASHDLQEPLRKIQAFGKLILQTQKFDAKTEDYFNRIISAGERMQNLIVSLLDFSRTSETELVFEPCNLNTIVEESRDNLQLNIVETGALIEYDSLPTIMASQVQLSQLFTNLIDNAIKYSRPQIKPIIKITAALVKGNETNHPLANSQKNYHQLKIEDNGIGFEKEYETKIFELFQRLHGRSEYSGTGIGLAIVKRIVTNHKGFIVAEGRPGNGATFIIYIPTA